MGHTSDTEPKISIRWNAKAEWKVEQNALLNRNCPLPKFEIALYDYIDNKYTKVWSKQYDSNYPTSLDSADIPPGRYVLGGSISHQRWQGPIIVEQSQIINKTYDVSVEE